jgi:WD40 repeat protein
LAESSGGWCSRGHTDWVDTVAWSPDGTHLATASWDGSARLWNPTTGEQLTTLAEPVAAVTED